MHDNWIEYVYVVKWEIENNETIFIFVIILRDYFNSGVPSCIIFDPDVWNSTTLFYCHIPLCSGMYLSPIIIKFVNKPFILCIVYVYQSNDMLFNYYIYLLYIIRQNKCIPMFYTYFVLILELDDNSIDETIGKFWIWNIKF